MTEGRRKDRWLRAIGADRKEIGEDRHAVDRNSPSDQDPRANRTEPHDPARVVEVAQEHEEEPSARRRGIFLLPNLITTGALFSGFYAVVAAMNGRFIAACIAIYAAMVLDTMDGRVARLTRTQSAFGAEYDSLSDMVAFGVAPALVAFSWALQPLGKVGWAVTFIYMACAALRLARYNTQGSLTSFTGLASPSAAAIVASAVWVLEESRAIGEPVPGAAFLLAVLTAVVGLLMVSPYRYFSPKMLNFKGRVPFFVLVAVALGFAVVFADPPRVLLLLFGVYALSAPAQHYYARWARRDRDASGERPG